LRASEPTPHFAVLKDIIFQQKLKPKYAKNGYYFLKICKNRQELQK